MPASLDQLDRQIVAILQRDGRTSNVEIARELSIAEGTVRKRLERLLQRGVIRIQAMVEPARLGYATRTFIGIETDLAQLEQVAARLAELPEVYSVHLVTGSYDILIEVLLESSDQLLSFLINQVAAISGVKRTETLHVMKVTKSGRDWSIPDSKQAQPEESGQPGTARTHEVLPGAIVLPS